MKAKNLLLAVPLAISVVILASRPAEAVCWAWKPCANGDAGYGGPIYGGGPIKESESPLPPLPKGGAAAPGTTGAPAATASQTPGGAPAKITPEKAAKKPATTAKATPAPAAAPAPAKATAAPAPAQATAVPPPKPAPVPAQAKAVPAPAAMPGAAPAPVPAPPKAAAAPAPAPVPTQAAVVPPPPAPPKPPAAAAPAPAQAVAPAAGVPGVATMKAPE